MYLRKAINKTVALKNRYRHIFRKRMLSWLIVPPIYKVLAKVFKVAAVTGKNSNLCLKEGFLPVPVHFYSPIPDIADLEQRRVWEFRSELPGINFDPKAQCSLLTELGDRFGDECKWPLKPTKDPRDFYVQNQSFSYGCAASTYCIIRKLKPQRVIEIGSGMSSKVILSAVMQNMSNDGKKCKYTIIDPYPGSLAEALGNSCEVVESRVELLDPKVFSELTENDILFIDSSHSVKIGSDVNYLFLEVLPRIKPGVVVHVHDIALPYEYPRAYAVNEVFRQFWTEQYLLQAFLSFNDHFQVLLSMSFLMADHPDTFRNAFRHYD